MIPKPRSINMVGVVQMLLAASFVIWLLGFPAQGRVFAWPVAPEFTAMFLGASFLLRTVLGFHLWRETQWYRLRWIVWGNYTFLGVILLATFWHLELMNWQSNILVAHIWVIAYIVEPLMLVLIEPHSAESRAPVPAELAEGPISRGLKVTLAGIYFAGIALAGIFVVNPGFADTRWPWRLDAFDARVMAAFLAASGVWAATMYFCQDWVEIKMGVRSLAIYSAALLGVWAISFGRFEPARKNGVQFGILCGLVTALLLFFYWRQEVARRGNPLPAGRETPRLAK